MNEFFSGLAALALCALTLVWCFDKLSTRLDAARRTKESRRAVLTALYQEIDLNLVEVSNFIEEHADWETGATKYDGNRVPIAQTVGHFIVYGSVMKNPAQMEPDVLPTVVSFYALLERLKSHLDGLRRENAQALRQTEQAAMLRQFHATAMDAIDLGQSFLTWVDTTSPLLRLGRDSQAHSLRNLANDGLAKRYNQFADRLDAARKKLETPKVGLQ